MKKFGNLKIGTRLSIIFLFIIVLVTGGYLYSIINTMTIKKELDKIYNIQLLSIDYLIEADRDAYQSSISISQALSSKINTSAVKFKETLASIDENHAQVLERFNKFKDIAYIVDTEENKKLLDVFNFNYMSLDTILNDIKENFKERDFSEVGNIYFGDYMNHFGEMRDAMDVFTGITLDEANKSYTESIHLSKNIRNNSIILSAVILIIMVLSVIVLSSSINRPLSFLVSYIENISEGDLTTQVPEKMLGKKDEVGMVLNSMLHMVEKLTTMVKDIKQNASDISIQSNQLNASSQQISEGANEQASSTEEISSSMEQMVANINQNSENSQTTEKKAIQVSQNISEGYKAVEITVNAMKTIAEKTSIIGEIAEKTDLLAINAAIEAARAGEHGKGFAVVAAEVRKLAERSQNAATQINELSMNSVKDAENAGKLLEEVVTEVDMTAKLVQEISAASMEMDTGAMQVNTSVQQLAIVTQQNSASSEEMAASSEELEEKAIALNDLIAFFKIEEEVQEKPVNKTKGKVVDIKEQKVNEKEKTESPKTKIKAKQKVVKEGVKTIVDTNDRDFEEF